MRPWADTTTVEFLQRPGVSHCPLPPSHLQETEKQNQALQQEVAELREELQARGPGGECLPWSQSPAPVS